MNSTIFGARDVSKVHASSVHAFDSPNTGALGSIIGQEVEYYRHPTRKHSYMSEFRVKATEALPRVGIIYSHVGDDPDIVQCLMDRRYAGIVVAGVGNGNFSERTLDALRKARDLGIHVVRSTHVSAGTVSSGLEVEDERLGFIPAGTLTPQKARILLALSILHFDTLSAVRAAFAQY
jgi:L-asparaginase